MTQIVPYQVLLVRVFHSLSLPISLKFGWLYLFLLHLLFVDLQREFGGLCPNDFMLNLGGECCKLPNLDMMFLQSLATTILNFNQANHLFNLLGQSKFLFGQLRKSICHLCRLLQPICS
jgi:hypothetical protein